MRFRTENKKELQEIVLFLESDTFDNKIVLKGLDNKGKEWNIMSFKDGKFKRISGISSEIGLIVTSSLSGRIVEESYDK